ncbi:MAG TPA: response regulator [Candidatus Acidoferrum sp.]|jgi:DNA-binding response OmpR family regulator|nr:response regulator [Candidatus Acidoferrum sp.]
MTTNTTFSSAEPVNPPPGHIPNLRQRILVVEDDAAIRRVNSEVLTYSGYQVDTAEDGAAAWETLQRQNYDLMITDNHMPRLTGIELIMKLHVARLALPVIMATGSSPDEHITRFNPLQPARVLLKPYTFHELLASVKEVLQLTNACLGVTAPPANWLVQPQDNRLQQ